MTNPLEAQRAIHDAIESKPREIAPGSEEQEAQRLADKARRQADAELRSEAAESTLEDRRIEDAQVAALQSSEIWDTNPDNRTRTFVSDELFPVQKIEKGDEEDEAA